MPAWQQHGIAIGRHGSGGCGSGAGVAVAGVSSAGESSAGESSAGESSAGVQRRGNGGVAAVAWQLAAWQPLGSASGGCIAFGAAGNTSLFHVRPCDDHGHAARRMLGYTPGSTVESGETATRYPTRRAYVPMAGRAPGLPRLGRGRGEIFIRLACPLAASLTLHKITTHERVAWNGASRHSRARVRPDSGDARMSPGIPHCRPAW